MPKGLFFMDKNRIFANINLSVCTREVLKECKKI